MKSKTKKVTYAAMFIAILILFQFSTATFGQFVTGSLVNLVLIASVAIGGLSIGIIVAAISPIMAFLLGIGPAFIQIIPLIMLGNLVIVLVYGLILKRISDYKGWMLSIVAGSVLKFLTLYLGIVKIALPLIPGLKEKQITLLSASFSWPQLVTALIGGIIAFLVVPYINKLRKNEKI